MTDDLSRAVDDYLQRQRDEDAGLSDEERQRLLAARAEQAEYKRLSTQADKGISVIEGAIKAINTEMAGRLPKLVEISRGGSAPGDGSAQTTKGVGYGLALPSGGYNGQTISFGVDPGRHVVTAHMSPPPGHYTQSPSAVLLGSSAFASVEWVRKMVAAYLDQKAS